MSRFHQIIATMQPESEDLALKELRERDPGLLIRATLASGVLLISLPDLEFDGLAAQWRNNPPIFLRHLCPVYAEARLSGAPGDLEQIQRAFDPLITLVQGELPFSVQTRILIEHSAIKPFDVNKALSEYIAETTGAEVDVRFPAQVISVVVGMVDGAIMALIGVSATEDNLSDWAGGVRRLAREEGQVSRSEFKLIEAFEVFNIDLPTRGQALDLGASPGGWTRILRQRQQYVTAIDPGTLDPRLKTDRGIRYRQMTAEAYLSNDPDTFDLIVNDMRMDARDSARLMVRYARLLNPGGSALMTLKLPEQDKLRIMQEAFTILQGAYTICGARQLFHNRSEITAYLKVGGHRD